MSAQQLKAKAERIVRELSKSTRAPQHAAHQMNLGSLIKALSRERTGLYVVTSNGDSPGMPHMYHGYYSDMAFEPSTELITVAEFIQVCDAAMALPFMGAEGEELFIKPNTPVWISSTGTYSGNAIVDLIPLDGAISLTIKNMD